MDKSNWRFCDTASGFDNLLELIAQMVDGERRVFKVRVSPANSSSVLLPGNCEFIVASQDFWSELRYLRNRTTADFFEIYSNPNDERVVIEVVVSSLERCA